MGDSDAKTVVERPQSGGSSPDPTEPDSKAEPAEPAALPARYSAQDEIGRGGMGRVVEARDELLGRTVAVKQALTLDRDILRRFERETQITARLEHPSIVPVYDAGRAADGTPYYVMRKVGGQRLDKLITDAATLDARLGLLPNLLAATQAIAHAHARGVVHRDLKPSNILVGDLGETIVIDWGLAKIVGEDDPEADATRLDAAGSLRTRVGTIVGTPGFMSPEQVRGDSIDARSDVFALGATLYYLLSRRYPHQSPTEDEVMTATADRPVPPIDTVVHGVPAELATITDKALAFAHADRYRDAGQLAEDLRRFLAGQLVASHRYSTWQRVRRFVRRNRIAVVTVALASTALVVGGAVAVRNVVAARDEALLSSRLAQEATKQQADRANEVTLAQARLLLDTNPTAAVAVARPLARTSYWREVRAIAADARAAGIAMKLPGPKTSLTSLSFMPDGKRALSVSEDGELWQYDVAAASGRKIGKLDHVGSLRPLDDTHVLCFSATKPKTTWLDLDTSMAVELPIDAPVDDAQTHGDSTWLVDQAGRVWKLAHATHALEPVTTREPAYAIAISPDGKTVAVGGQSSVWLTTGAVTKKIVLGDVRAMAWSEDATRLTVLAKKELVEIDIATGEIGGLSTASTLTTIGNYFGRTYAAGINGILVDGRPPPGWSVAPYIAGLYPGPGNTVTSSSDNVISIMRNTVRFDITPPMLPVISIATSTRSRYLLAVCRGVLLRYDLEAITGVALDGTADATVAHSPIRDHLMLAVHGNAPATWVDLATGVRTPGPELPLSLGTVDSPDGKHVFTFDVMRGPAWLITPNTAEQVAIQSDVGTGAFIDETQIATGSRDGVVRVIDINTLTPREIYRHGTQPIVVLRASAGAGVVVAAFADGHVARIRIDTGAAETWERPDHTAWTRGLIQLTRDGKAWLGDGTKLLVWPPGGTPAEFATTPEPIDGTVEASATSFLVHTTIGDTFLVDTASPAPVPSVAMESRNITRATAVKRLGHAKAGTGLLVLDTVANTSFRAARMNGKNDSVSITPDGRYAYAHPDNLWVVFDIALPETPDETGRWLDGMTNAVAGRGGTLTWP